MKILVIGNGAREHAIAWKLHHSPRTTELLVAPGNAGTIRLGQNVSIETTDVEELLRFAQEAGIDLTVVGPEAPLAAGISDRFQQAGLTIFGPTKEAALIESSKSFAKELMMEHGVPTGRARIFSSYNEARTHINSLTLPIVIKADGLAAGKGVTVAETREEALEALRMTLEDRQFGPAGDTVLIEEYLEGEELSVFAFVDGSRVSEMVAASDYKRLGNGGVGPNTGGMGSFSPPLTWNHDLEHTVRRTIMEPVVEALAERGRPYRGVLYAGLILTKEGPKVLEFNCRLGDPEAQVILPRLKTDLVEVMMGAATGSLASKLVQWNSQACVGVVMASGGYPGRYHTGHPIEGLDEVEEEGLVFHAGTSLSRADGEGKPRIVTGGGRVLTVTATGNTLEEARRWAYANVERIRFKDAVYRKDIAARK